MRSRRKAQRGSPGAAASRSQPCSGGADPGRGFHSPRGRVPCTRGIHPAPGSGCYQDTSAYDRKIMEDVWSAAQIHHTTLLKIPKLICLSNLGKIYSEQIGLKALEKSPLQPSRVPASLYPTPQLPSSSAWAKGTGACSPLATLPALQAPRGASPSHVQPPHPCTLRDAGPGASSRLLDSSQRKLHPVRHRRRGVLRGMNVHRGCGS